MLKTMGADLEEVAGILLLLAGPATGFLLRQRHRAILKTAWKEEGIPGDDHRRRPAQRGRVAQL
ncbi:hypothetical protein IVB15_15465 [Bradyrhizobium sp. 182]|uniref:hypothetical protein n=1 Tax=Bradyrhizobium sp. 182 TaxID=2782651 RepID=UPI001FFA5DCB|nr:hypothetical protein [Bradyrhizobium sp. 182]MCK1529079.1 hypothetical protein [Bradyrhizobium sp. 182]